MKSLMKFILGLTILIAGSAWADTIWFTSPEQAAKKCPALDGLTYNAFTSTQGTIMGKNPDNRIFTSFNANTNSKLVARPKNISDKNSGPVDNVSFRFALQGYGYITDKGVIACFYSYPTYFGADYALLMRSL